MAVYVETLCDCIGSSQVLASDWRYEVSNTSGVLEALAALVGDTIPDAVQSSQTVIDVPVANALDQIGSKQLQTPWATVASTFTDTVGVLETLGGVYSDALIDAVQVDETVAEAVVSLVTETADDLIQVSETAQGTATAQVVDSVGASETVHIVLGDTIVDVSEVTEWLTTGWTDGLTDTVQVREALQSAVTATLDDTTRVSEVLSDGAEPLLEALEDRVQVSEALSHTADVLDVLGDTAAVYETLTPSALYGWLFSAVTTGDQPRFPAAKHTLEPVLWAYDDKVGLSSGVATVDSGDLLPNRFGVAVIDSPQGALFNLETVWARGGFLRNSRASDGKYSKAPLLRNGYARFSFGKRLQVHTAKLTFTDFEWLRQATVRVAWSKRRY